MTADRRSLVVALLASLAAVAGLTLLPTGSGWAWGSPATELRWYASGLASGATVVQLAGNLGLLAVPAALAVLLEPALGTPRRLLAAGLTAGAGIELLQWLLPLGRVVSPLDAALNATGALVAGLLVTGALRFTRRTTSAPETQDPRRRAVHGGAVRLGGAPAPARCTPRSAAVPR